MSDEERRPLIERDRIRREHQERERTFGLDPERTKIVSRARVRILHDFLKEAQVGRFTFTSDESPPSGEGAAPTPLGYFVAAVGF